MTKKSLFLGSLAILGLFVLAKTVQASNEPALSDVNVSNGLIGTVQTSTGAGRAGETRRLTTDDLGELLTVPNFKEVVISTGYFQSGFGSAGNSSNTFVVNASSWVGAVGCRGLQDNCNVVRLASVGSPVYVDKIFWDSVVGGGNLSGANSGRAEVRLFDSRGSTAQALTMYQSNSSSGTWSPVEMWFSSGVVLMKDSTATVVMSLGKQNR